MTKRTAISAVVAGVLLLLVTAGGVYNLLADDGTSRTAFDEQPVQQVDPLTQAIEAAQQRLENLPGDYSTWAELGSAYVEQARVTADPSYYPKAEGALQESLALRPADNDAALTGLGALANARHDFAAAADLARRALEINSYSATAYGVLTDALTQLGDYPGATAAVQQMLALRPGIASFTRASYDFELHGDIDNARAALEQALEGAQGSGAESFCRYYLGQLAFTNGDPDGAAEQFAAGLDLSPNDPSLILGQARVDAAQGDVEQAVRGFQNAVNARPLPENLIEFGQYLESLGRMDEAQSQFDLVTTVRTLFAENGVADDLGTALFAADHGDPATAVTAAQAEYQRRQNIDSSDAMAWALYSAGRYAEALPYATAATSIGGANALFLYHRGMIESALGMREQARDSLSLALETNPYFSPLHQDEAQAALAALGGPN
ncbi:MAG: tetratricopeptide repeat protein [Actinomycetota bacterium]|nr:tetratricopeptide repeat protein [Actinomycetota bacterium]